MFLATDDKIVCFVRAFLPTTWRRDVRSGRMDDRLAALINQAGGAIADGLEAAPIVRWPGKSFARRAGKLLVRR